LRSQAPEIEVVLIERAAKFRSLPLSNKWLVGQVDGERLTFDYRTAADHWGYCFVQAEVSAIARDKHLVMTNQGNFAYDWLILATGIREDFTAWFGDDQDSADFARTHYPSAYSRAEDLDTLKRKLDSFTRGILLMTLPPAPYRCPPAPYERALLIAGWLEAHQRPAKLLILDPNTPPLGFQQAFEEQYAKRIDYRSQTQIESLDPRRKEVHTEFDEFAFDDAILMPPQQASELVWQAGLVGRDTSGKPTGWAVADPLSLQSVTDERIFLVGDLLDRVSPLFGHYPKSGQMASRQGRIVAQHIAAQIRGKPIPMAFPDSLCHVATRFDPPESVQIETNYRLRGDGEIMQQSHTHHNAQPRGEDLAWLSARFEEFGARR
jgi:NADPH-dependent 2,4-dienoyl-CoA reductase/sulfur reductase-like enzyme